MLQKSMHTSRKYRVEEVSGLRSLSESDSGTAELQCKVGGTHHRQHTLEDLLSARRVLGRI